MAKKPKRGEGMWDTVTEEDFVNESNIVDEDIAEYVYVKYCTPETIKTSIKDAIAKMIAEKEK